ncbi:MAG: hypothetical protein HYZ28_17080 [Myxococcales bacterium]|nr:hypothetical protein [Myxococcales bacterium]
MDRSRWKTLTTGLMAGGAIGWILGSSLGAATARPEETQVLIAGTPIARGATVSRDQVVVQKVPVSCVTPSMLTPIRKDEVVGRAAAVALALGDPVLSGAFLAPDAGWCEALCSGNATSASRPATPGR